MKVSKIMTRDVTLLNPDQTICVAASLMAEIDAGALPVGENDRLVGMITDRDIVVRAVAQGRSVDTKVAAVMSKEVLYCFDTDEIDEVARNMGKARVRRLPVAANIAFNTAGAATAIVGSPTPPQKPPDGITMVSTAGISLMRST